MTKKIFLFSFFILILFIGLNFAFSKSGFNVAEATHGFTFSPCTNSNCHVVYVNFCNTNTGTNWQVHYSLIDDSGTLLGWRNPWLNASDGASPCGTYNGYFLEYGPVNNSNNLKMQWWTSCVDPIVKAIQVATGGVDARADVTCKQGVGGIYAKCDNASPNNLGPVAWDATCPLEPACSSNCSSSGAHQCSGATSQTCQDVDSSSAVCLQWVNTDVCSSGSCDNGTGQCRHNGCNASNTCVWLPGDGANGCPGGSSDCIIATPTPTTPPAGGTCTGPNGVPFAVGEQYCAGDSYPGNGPTVGSVVCASPITTDYRTCTSGGTFSVNNCSAGTACGYINSKDVGCYAACTSSTCTYQACDISNTCQTYTSTSPCPPTNCSACPGGSC